MSDDQIEHMVRRFLMWKLPENFQPDAGISFKPEFNVEWNAKQGLPPQRHQPVGTNLFDYDQATAMVRHMLEGLPRSASTSNSALVEAWSAEGTIRALRSGVDSPSRGKVLDEQCICCEGPHIFANRIELEGIEPTWTGQPVKSLQDWSYRLLTAKTGGVPRYDGRRFRVTIEMLPEQRSTSKGEGSVSEAWKKYAADFDGMTDEQVEYERQAAQNLVDENEEWLEAVASWEAAGKPRSEKEPRP